MAVSANKRYVAIAERGVEKPQCAIVDLHSLRRRKVLVPQEGDSRVGDVPIRGRLVSRSAPI